MRETRLDVEAAVAEVFRDQWGRIVATLIRVTGDWDIAEECAQDAFEKALERWERDGVPRNPGAWLTTTARHRALDRLRRAKTEASKYEAIGVMARADGIGDDQHSGINDDRLRLIFTCCHPALSLEAQVALTLRTLTGMTTVEIARAFLVPEQAMAKRLVRAKGKIRDARIPYRVPPGSLLPERTVAVLGVLYLLFNEGYSASGGPELVRTDLCSEAIRLARLLAQLMPDEPEALGLLAVMLLHHARRAGRIDDTGVLVPLEEQVRTLWDSEMIEEGCSVLDAALRQGRPGPYQIQAAIAACHATAAQPENTDWAEIALLYRRLGQLVPSAVVELNRAVAVAMSEGLAAGLELVNRLVDTDALPGYHLVPATQADLLRRMGRFAEASIAYEEAIALAGTDAERRYLRRRHRETTS